MSLWPPHASHVPRIKNVSEHVPSVSPLYLDLLFFEIISLCFAGWPGNPGLKGSHCGRLQRGVWTQGTPTVFIIIYTEYCHRAPVWTLHPSSVSPQNFVDFFTPHTYKRI